MKFELYIVTTNVSNPHGNLVEESCYSLSRNLIRNSVDTTIRNLAMDILEYPVEDFFDDLTVEISNEELSTHTKKQKKMI